MVDFLRRHLNFVLVERDGHKMSINKQGKYARRTSVSIRRSKKIPLIIGCAAAFFLVVVSAVIVGNILRKKASVYTPYDSRYNLKDFDLFLPPKDAKNVKAYAYKFGTDASANIGKGIKDFSVCLRYADGSVAYNSEICGSSGFDSMNGSVSLKDNTDYIHALGGYVCGYVYINSFGCENPDLRRIKTAYEISLISEAAKAGVDDILLVGININEENSDEVANFVNEISSIADNCKIGVLIDRYTFEQTSDGIYIAGKILKAGNYVALDLRELYLSDGDLLQGEEGPDDKELFAKELNRTDYLIKSYKARLVFGKNDSERYEYAVSAGYDDCQMVVE